MKTRTCPICGAEYPVCACPSRSWRRIACSPKHYQMYIILQELDLKTIDKDTAKSKLIELNIDNETILPYIKSQIDELFE